MNRALLLALCLLSAAPLRAEILTADAFDYADGLITDEFAFYNPYDSRAVKSPVWDVTSGAFYAKGLRGWTNSPVFRAVTDRADIGDAVVSFALTHQGYFSTTATPAVDWDGVHVFLRYKDENNLYAATVNRRDGKILIKKKYAGVYYQLGSYAAYAPVQFNRQAIRVEALNSGGGVAFKVFVDGVQRFSTADTGVGGPVLGPGRVGLRGDNSEFYVDDFAAESPYVVPPPPPPPPADTAAPYVNIYAPADGSRVSGPVVIKADAVDLGGVAGVTFAADGAAIGPEDTVAPYEVLWTPSAGRGWTTITATARDAAGNRAGDSIRLRSAR